MEKKVVLIILILIAVAAVAFLVVGLARPNRDIDPEHYQPKAVLRWMDGVFARSRKPFDLGRMRLSGCTLSERTLGFSDECTVVIDTSRTKSSAFELVRGSSVVEACYAFSAAKLSECWGDSDARGTLDEPRHRFVVTRDSAFLRLKCLNATSPCRLIVE